MAARRPDPVSIARRAEVVRLAQTLTAEAIASRTGYTLSMVYLTCRRAGVQPRTPSGRGRRFDQQNG
jgi:hypothetical protein